MEEKQKLYAENDIRLQSPDESLADEFSKSPKMLGSQFSSYSIGDSPTSRIMEGDSLISTQRKIEMTNEDVGYQTSKSPGRIFQRGVTIKCSPSNRSEARRASSPQPEPNLTSPLRLSSKGNSPARKPKPGIRNGFTNIARRIMVNPLCSSHNEPGMRHPILRHNSPRK